MYGDPQLTEQNKELTRIYSKIKASQQNKHLASKEETLIKLTSHHNIMRNMRVTPSQSLTFWNVD